jgi:hypothetical protein
LGPVLGRCFYRERVGPQRRPVQLQIIATTEAGTRAALTEARQLARRLNVVRTVLLVPRIGPQTSAEAPAKDVEAVEDFRQMAGQTGLDVTVRLCVCGRYSEMSRWMLPQDAVVVVGGSRRWWWPTRAQRIADHLERAGRVIVFADESEPAHVTT